MTSIGLLRTLPPKSSTAMRTAMTDPAPERSASAPPMSVSTPMRTTSPDTVPCAAARSDTEQRAVASATRKHLGDIDSLQDCSGSNQIAGLHDVFGKSTIDTDVLASDVRGQA